MAALSPKTREAFIAIAAGETVRAWPVNGRAVRGPLKLSVGDRDATRQVAALLRRGLLTKGDAPLFGENFCITEKGSALARVLRGEGGLFCDRERQAPPGAPRAFLACGRFRHLAGPDLAELDAYAESIGLRREWRQSWRNGGEHYDVTGKALAELNVALAAGIIAVVDDREFLTRVAGLPGVKAGMPGAGR